VLGESFSGVVHALGVLVAAIAALVAAWNSGKAKRATRMSNGQTLAQATEANHAMLAKQAARQVSDDAERDALPNGGKP